MRSSSWRSSSRWRPRSGSSRWRPRARSSRSTSAAAAGAGRTACPSAWSACTCPCRVTEDAVGEASLTVTCAQGPEAGQTEERKLVLEEATARAAGSGRRWLGVAAAVVLVAGGAWLVSQLFGKGGVPDLRGLTHEEAEARLAEENLRPEIRYEPAGSAEDEGVVMRTIPRRGRSRARRRRDRGRARASVRHARRDSRGGGRDGGGRGGRAARARLQREAEHGGRGRSVAVRSRVEPEPGGGHAAPGAQRGRDLRGARPGSVRGAARRRTRGRAGARSPRDARPRRGRRGRGRRRCRAGRHGRPRHPGTRRSRLARRRHHARTSDAPAA